MSAHVPFSWLSPEAQYIPGARDAESTHDAAAGIALILEMIEASDLAAETDGQAELTPNDRAVLMRMAMTTARMLRENARKHIEWLNTHGVRQAA